MKINYFHRRQTDGRTDVAYDNRYFFRKKKKTTKNRQCDTNDKNNYRPIAIVIALSKIFELCIMRMIETHLVTSGNQFGFKREHGTDLCIFTVKSVIKYYNLHNSPV